MAISIEEGFEQSKNKLKVYKTFLQSKTEIKKQRLKNKLDEKKLARQQKSLERAKKNQERKERVQSSYDQLIDILQMAKGAAKPKDNYITNLVVKVAKQIKPKISEIITDEMLKSLNCSEESTYDNLVIYIKVSSLDLGKILLINPTDTWGKCIYEQNPYDSSLVKKSTNQLLYYLIQTPTPLSQGNINGITNPVNTQYKGQSGQNLFDIQFVTVDNNGTPGQYYKITLTNRALGLNRVSDFINDYFKVNSLLDLRYLLTTLTDIILGCVSADLKLGDNQLDDSTRFGLIIQRILGQCQDYNVEIDVGGQSKYPEVDNSTDSIFEMESNDLEFINERVQSIKVGIREFVDCNNVALPISNTNYLSDNISNVGDDGENLDTEINNIITNLVNDPRWVANFPFPDAISLSLNKDFISQLPMAIIKSIFSPKVLLPYIIMAKAIGNMYSEGIEGYNNFLRNNRALVQAIGARIMALFLEALLIEIKKIVIALAKAIVQDMTAEKKATIARVINKIVSLSVLIAQTINDFRECRSLVDYLLKLFQLRIPLPKQITPTPILALSDILDGASTNRAYMNHLEFLQSLGLPTGPNPNGTPMYSNMEGFSIIQGLNKEKEENGKTEMFIKPIPIAGYATSPIRVTGKYF